MIGASSENFAVLASIETPSRVSSWLRRNVSSNVLEKDDYWRYVGGLRSNAMSIHASADEVNPLVERIVNGLEAVIELEVANSGYVPASPRDAAQVLFGVTRGQVGTLTDSNARSLADNVQLIFKGQRREPTVVVRDRGIGIHPSEFDTTILAIGQSDKGDRPYLIGMYGHGGSSTFDKCEYTVILSRRRPSLLTPSQKDQVGWTVVRRQIGGRLFRYRYLVDPATGKVPFGDGSDGSSIDLAHGTLVAHIGYKGLGGCGARDHQ